MNLTSRTHCHAIRLCIAAIIVRLLKVFIFPPPIYPKLCHSGGVYSLVGSRDPVTNSARLPPTRLDKFSTCSVFNSSTESEHWRIHDLPVGRTMASEPKRGSEAEPPCSGVQGQSPWWGSGAKPPKAESFLYILYTKRAKSYFWPSFFVVKDLSENLSPCSSRAAVTDPKFWSMGRGRPPGPLIAGSATGDEL